MLKYFDIAVSNAPNIIVCQVVNVPNSLPETNIGVILFKHSQSANIFFQEWLNIYNKDMNKQTNFSLWDTYNPLLQVKSVLAPKATAVSNSRQQQHWRDNILELSGMN